MPATIFVPQPRPAYASANVPWISSHARTQRPQTMHSLRSILMYGWRSSFSYAWRSPA